jgi:hypothetical protein
MYALIEREGEAMNDDLQLKRTILKNGKAHELYYDPGAGVFWWHGDGRFSQDFNSQQAALIAMSHNTIEWARIMGD